MTTPRPHRVTQGWPPDAALLSFDWVMAPVEAFADAFFGLLHMRLPVYARPAIGAEGTATPAIAEAAGGDMRGQPAASVPDQD